MATKSITPRVPVPPLPHRHRVSNKRELPLYYSPRCETPDEDLLVSDHSLKSREERWESISSQAGSHRQDGSLMVISRPVSSHALRLGAPPSAAARVRSLHIPLNEKDNLPEWLDTIGSMFLNLEHLYLSGNHETASNDHHNIEKARMRRLYVLYRMPNLKSIDGKAVTQTERQVARHVSPSGHKVQREEWVIFNSSSVDDSQDNGGDWSKGEPGNGVNDAIEVSLLDAVLQVPAEISKEETTKSWDLKQGLFNEKETSSSKKSINALAQAECEEDRMSSVTDHPRIVDKPVGGSYGAFALPYFNGIPFLPGKAPCQNRSRTSSDLPKINDETDKGTISHAGNAQSAPTSPMPSFDSLDRLDFQSFRSENASFDTLAPAPTIFSVASSDTVNVPALRRSGFVNPATCSTRTRSLASPFPMQFREQIRPPRSSSSIDFLTMPSLLEKNGSGRVISEGAPRKGTIIPKKGEVMPSRDVLECTTNRQTTLKEKNVKTEHLVGSGSKPPKCPGSRRSVVTSKGSRREKRGFRRWGSRKAAPSNSIMDCEEDDSNTDEEENDSFP